MALKFLNKKGWHTGSLRNIENVWKAEQKHEAEQKKLEELRKQIQEERERSEFRLLQEQAGLVPKQERLDFLYDSGLAVGRSSGNSKGGEGIQFKAAEGTVPNSNAAPSSSSAKQSSVLGALFEDKPQSANDAWRKLNSDPLLLIRQREQEALARVKNNPVKMALIRKSAETSKEKDKAHDKKERRKKHKHSDEKHLKHSSSKHKSDSENVGAESGRRRMTSDFKRPKYDEHHYKARVNSDGESNERENQRGKTIYKGSKYDEHHYKARVNSDGESSDRESRRRKDTFSGSKDRRRSPSGLSEAAKIDIADRRQRESRSFRESRSYDYAVEFRHDSQYKCRNTVPKLSEEERAARLREMQVDAELHEEQRFKRLRKAEEKDAQEAATHANRLSGRNFLDAAHKSVYGAEKGGSSTIEESVRRRTHYLQGRSDVEGNAFRQ